MYVVLELIGLCLAFWLLCFLGTGTDEKNAKSLASYPDPVQERVRKDPRFQNLKPPASKGAAFLSNLILFTPLLFLLGLPVRESSFWQNFGIILILGEGLNLFDLLVIDLLWWRNSKRIRFTGTENNPELYRDPKKHVDSFLRALVLYLVVALIDGAILTIF